MQVKIHYLLEIENYCAKMHETVERDEHFKYIFKCIYM